MDQIHDHGLLIKKVSKFLVSVCVCCFCFSQASLLSFLQSIFYLSTFPYKIFTHTMDKNSIFLIFNLLLVVLAKYSGLIRSLSWSSTCYRISDEASFNINTEGGFRVESSMLRQEDQEAMASSSTDNASNIAEQKGEFLINQVEQDADNAVEEYKEEEHAVEEYKEEEHAVEEYKEEEHAVEEYKEEEHDEPEGRFITEEEGEEETGIFAEEDVEAGNEMLMSSTSTEELNKKFEDFIRRMKEELRIEAQRQPIMV